MNGDWNVASMAEELDKETCQARFFQMIREQRTTWHTSIAVMDFG
jgi:hypothetical protein